VADIAYAVRDVAPVPAQAELFAAFLTGYRRIRPLPEPDLAYLPLFTAAHAARSAVRARSAIDAASPTTRRGWVGFAPKSGPTRPRSAT
jgi:Ser/Thr protein kinase RdoA (MazF antagonist)